MHVTDETYVRTSAVSSATELLNSENLLILFGRAGSGKSSTALEISSIFHAKGYIILKLEQNLAKDFKKYFISKNKQLIIFEDVFGKSDVKYDEDLHANFLNVLEPHIHNGINKFIITIRSYKVKDIDQIMQSHKVLSKAVSVNLNGHSSLQKSEKKDILTVIAKHYRLDIGYTEIQKIIKTDPYLGYPEACRLFCSIDNFRKLGHKFFSSPSEELKREISTFKQSGKSNPDLALQYCTLVSLMLDITSEDLFCMIKDNVNSGSFEPSKTIRNFNTSVIEYVYRSLYGKDQIVTTDDLVEMCEELTKRYIQKDINSNAYVFQHHTISDAVLTSYWCEKTMKDVIKYCSVNILVEHVRPFDYTCNGKQKYLLVTLSNCDCLAQKLLETFPLNYLAAVKCNKIINESKFTLNLLNQKLSYLYTAKRKNILDCEWNIITKFIRPSKYQNLINGVCVHACDKYLIERLIEELDIDVIGVKHYIEKYGDEEFVNDFNNNFSKRFQSEESIVNCTWYLISYFVRPDTFKITKGTLGTLVNSRWLIKRLINELVDGEVDRACDVKQYIDLYGCEAFVTDFNEKLTKWCQSNENIINCTWGLIHYFLRPTSCEIDKGPNISFHFNSWLQQRLLKELVNFKADRALKVKQYIQRYGCAVFFQDFNEKLTRWFECKGDVECCTWGFIYNFVRPETFKLQKGQIGFYTSDRKLIERLINELRKSDSDKELKLLKVKHYIKMYGSEGFIKDFNEKLTELFQLEEKIKTCTWATIKHFVRPTTLKIDDEKGCILATDRWIIQRLIHELKSETNTAGEIKLYIQMFGSEGFVKDLNENLTEWLKSKRNVENCTWELIYYFVRPTTFKTKQGKIGTVTNDSWLTQRLINRFINPEAGREFQVKLYVDKYGCENIVNECNNRLAEWLKSKVNFANCTWNSINHFVRPSKFKIEHGKLGVFTNDIWLIQRIVNEFLGTMVKKVCDNGLIQRGKHELMKFKMKRVQEIQQYIENYGNKQFVNNFNKELSQLFHKKEDIVNCMWIMIDVFVRPTSIQIENDQIGTYTNDNWLFQRVINELIENNADRVSEVKQYIERYSCDELLKYLNENLQERFQSVEAITTCSWDLIDFLVRPKEFDCDNRKLVILTNESWLIDRIISELIRINDDRPFDRYLKSRNDSNNEKSKRIAQIKQFIERNGSDEFVNIFNLKLAKCFELYENVQHCAWDLIDYFVRPAIDIIESGNIGIVMNNSWLIQKLINKLTTSMAFGVLEVKHYLEKYRSEEFDNQFNETLKEWLKLEKHVVNSSWSLIKYFVRPTACKIENPKIGSPTSDSWLIQKLIQELVNPNFDQSWEVKWYLEKYGDSTLIMDFNEKLTDWFQSEDNLVNCKWGLISYFLRPKMFKINFGTLGSFTNDIWLIQRLVIELMNPQASVTSELKRYIERYGCEEFVKYFNEKLSDINLTEEYIVKCSWVFMKHFVRPKTFKMKIGKIGTLTNNSWVMRRLINELVKPKADKTLEVYEYITNFGCKGFITDFNIKLTEWLLSEVNAANVTFDLIYYFVRPSTFKIESGELGSVTNDSWLIQRLKNELMDAKADRAWEVNQYITKFGIRNLSAI